MNDGLILPYAQTPAQLWDIPSLPRESISTVEAARCSFHFFFSSIGRFTAARFHPKSHRRRVFQRGDIRLSRVERRFVVERASRDSNIRATGSGHQSPRLKNDRLRERLDGREVRENLSILS